MALPPLPNELNTRWLALPSPPSVGGPAHPQAAISTKKIIDDINHAVTQSQRLQALQICRHAMNHQDEAMHNYEMDLGAANALCLKLGYILLQSSGPHDDAMLWNKWYSELAMVCGCLRLVYGCSVDRRICNFCAIGTTELLPLLSQLLKNLTCSQRSSSHLQQSKLKVIHEAISVLRILAKLDVAKSHLIHSSNLFTTLVKLIWALEVSSDDLASWSTHQRDDDDMLLPTLSESSDFSNPMHIRFQILGLWKDLSFRTSDSDKLSLYRATAHSLHHVAKQSLTATRLVHEYVASVLWNLALAPSVSREMAQNEEVLSVLQHLIVLEESAKTRRSAISALGNLATVADNQAAIVQHKGLVEVLLQASEAEDTDSRRRAMRTIRCLIAGEAASDLKRRQKFVTFLAHVVVHDVDSSTKIQACECLGHVAADKKAIELVGDLVTQALVETIERCGDDKVTPVAFRILATITSRPQELKLVAIKAAGGFFTNLGRCIAHSKDVVLHHCCGHFVSRLSEEEESSDKMTSTAVLNVLAALLLPAGPEYDSSRLHALQVIQGLAETETNRRRLAEHEEIMTALVNFAVAAEGSKKDDAKRLILQLVPEL